MAISMYRARGHLALRIVGALFLIIALLGLFSAGVITYLGDHSGRLSIADGHIIGFSYGPTVEFKTSRGEIVQFSSPVRSTFWRIGDQVAVAYSPDQPEHAAIDGIAGRWFMATLFAGLAVIFGLIGSIVSLIGWISRGQRDPRL